MDATTQQQIYKLSTQGKYQNSREIGLGGIPFTVREVLVTAPHIAGLNVFVDDGLATTVQLGKSRQDGHADFPNRRLVQGCFVGLGNSLQVVLQRAASSTTSRAAGTSSASGSASRPDSTGARAAVDRRACMFHNVGS